jgi:hypothetical protein
MMSYQHQNVMPQPLWEGQLSETFGAVMRQVYVWMALGLFLTAGVAAVTANSPLVYIIGSNPVLFYGLLIGEVALVFGIALGINRLSPTTAVVLFFVYAALNGLTFSFIFIIYTLGSVALAFGTTASLFWAMSIIGYTTKMDLSKFGSYLLMALIGLILASVVNIFWANTAFGWIITYVAIFIFLGLTVYHTQRIKQQTIAALRQGDQQLVARIGLLGALSLYLDFINLFLNLLRIMGRRR